MKLIRLTSFTFLFCAACASPRPRPPMILSRCVPTVDASKQPPASLRSTERIIAYPFARYIDPNHSEILHEAHTVYRVERRPHWNLRPGPNRSSLSSVSTGARCASSARSTGVGGNFEKSPSASRDEWLVEMQRQKSVAAELVKLNQTLESRVGELSAQISQSAQDTDKRLHLEKELKSTHERLTRLESEIKSAASPPSADSHDRNSEGSSRHKPQKSAAWDW